ncbi:hypothetical protein ENBRE01_2333 [Enteropsectra breve]|nr:hypothetical protein ENBRE01_2333 [Enteropsectra breve]
MSDNVSSQQLATTSGNVPQFSREPTGDIVHWINIFKLAVLAKSLNSDASRLLLLCLLTGEAKNFYMLIEVDEESLNDVLNALQTRFEKPFRTTLLSKLKSLSRLPNESIAAFFERYIVLARRCNIPEELQLDWITDHLPQQLITILATFTEFVMNFLRKIFIPVFCSFCQPIFSVCHSIFTNFFYQQNSA